MKSALAPSMSERELMQSVLDLAAVLKWRTAHFRPAHTESGWRTAVSGDGVGFPDILAVRGGRVLAMELKSTRGKATTDQLMWLSALESAGVEAHIFRPAEWVDGTIERTLR